MKDLKTQIREGFETNSSSSHSFSLSKSGKKFDLKRYRNEVIYSHGGEYGWGPDVLSTFEEKLSYLCQAGNLNIVEDILKTRLNAEVVFRMGEDDYIDHESAGELNFNYDENGPEKVENLLLCEDSYIYILNDNECYYTEGKNIWKTSVDREYTEKKVIYKNLTLRVNGRTVVSLSLENKDEVFSEIILVEKHFGKGVHKFFVNELASYVPNFGIQRIGD